MDNLNNIPNVGNWGDAASKLNDNFNKVKQAVTTVENVSKNNKGYFTSLSALNTAFPSPKAGQTAYVYNEASSSNYYIYNAVSGAWVTSSIEAPPVGADLNEYTKTGGSTKTTKDIDVIKANHGYDSSPKTLKEVDDDLAQLADNTVPKVKSDLVKFVFGEDIDLETKPALTDGYYISGSGDSVPTGLTTYSSTLDFIPLYGAKKLHYFGRFGNSSTRLVFYSEMSRNSIVLVVPQSNREIFDEIFDIPVEAKYYRVTCGFNAKNNFKVVLIGVGSSLKLESFRFVGAPVYENDAIKQSNIIWNDGSSGVVIFNNWNEENLTFTSFVATSIENGVTVTQPPVTFNSNNQITNYPNFIISEI